MYEVLRNHLGFRYHTAGALAFLSTLLAFMVLDMMGSALRFSPIQWPWTLVISCVWLWSPYVLWLIFRIRRARAPRHPDTKT